MPCDRVTVVPVDEVMRTGVMKGMTGNTDRAGVEWCRPNYKKLEEITARPGELLIFVKKLSSLERLSVH
jgi:hypothetical protein